MAECLEVVPDKAHNLEYGGASPSSATTFLRRLVVRTPGLDPGNTCAHQVGEANKIVRFEKQ